MRADSHCVSEGSTEPIRELTQQADFAESVMDRLSLAQQQLDALRQQLTDSQRLATIGTIAAVIAHEFNNILTPVVSYAQYALTSAQSDTPDMELIRKALTKSFQGSSKAGKICTSMLALARGESTPGVVSVQQLVDEALLVLARDPQKDGIALRVQVQPDLLVSVDPVQLEQVLLNLLINARHAMLGKGGSLTVKAIALEEEGIPTEARLQVIDTGRWDPRENSPQDFPAILHHQGNRPPRRGEGDRTWPGDLPRDCRTPPRTDRSAKRPG